MLYNLKDIGENCRRFREKNGITQEELAHRIGKNQSDISKFETGKGNNTHLEVFIKYIDALDMSILDAFGTSNAPTESEETQILIKYYQKLNNEDRIAVINHTAGLLSLHYND